ncbi:WD40 repeat-like protein, partial [Rhizopogon salebrosus TDB-379]
MAEIAPIIRVTEPLRQFQDHKSSVTAVAVFPDGHRMITSSMDRTLVLWDLQDGVSLKKMKGHRSWVLAVAVSKDGKLIASGDDDGKLITWHGDTGELLIQTARVHPSSIRSLDFSSDGAVLASGSFDTTTELWSTETWQVQGNPINLGSHLDPTIREWDTSTWKQVGEPWTGHANDINTILVNPNTTFIASASNDCQVRLWRLSDRRTIAILNDTSEVYCVSFSADGTRILSGGDSTTLILWNLKDGVVLKQMKGHKSTVRTLAVSRDGKLIASGDDNGVLIVWHGVTGEFLTQAITVHSRSIVSVDFSQDGTALASGSYDKTTEIWCTKTWQVSGD